MNNLKKVLWTLSFLGLQGAGVTAIIMVRRDGMMWALLEQLFVTFLIVFLWGMFTMKVLKHCHCENMQKAMK